MEYLVEIEEKKKCAENESKTFDIWFESFREKHKKNNVINERSLNILYPPFANDKKRFSLI